MRAPVLLLIAGCGRLWFDPLAGGTDGGGSDAPMVDALDPSLAMWFPFDTGPGEVIGGSTATCLPSCPTLAPGKHGMAMQFNGTNQCLKIDDSGVTHTQALTLAIWIDQPAYGEYAIFSKPYSPATSDNDSWQTENHATMKMGFTTTNAGRHDVLYTNSYATGAWHHVAMTFDGATKRIYTDGVLVMATAEPDAIQYDTSAILMGCDVNTGNVVVYPYAGLLDDVRFYTRALSDAEVATLAQ